MEHILSRVSSTGIISLQMLEICLPNQHPQPISPTVGTLLIYYDLFPLQTFYKIYVSSKIKFSEIYPVKICPVTQLNVKFSLSVIYFCKINFLFAVEQVVVHKNVKITTHPHFKKKNDDQCYSCYYMLPRKYICFGKILLEKETENSLRRSGVSSGSQF